MVAQPGASGAPRARPAAALEACRVLGALSVASGLALVCAPLAASNIFGLPRAIPLLRALGLRDVAAGSLLLSPRTASAGCALRAISDALDFGLIANEAACGRRSQVAAAVRLAGAAALVALAEELRERLGSEAE